MRRLTKIICTWGPTSHTPAQIEKLARAGMDVLRFNLSHGSWDAHAKTLGIVRTLNAKLAREGKTPTCVTTLLDTKGAEVRTETVKTPLKIREGELVVFSHRPCPGERKQVILVNYKGFQKDAKQAEQILLDNGKMSFALVQARKDGSVVAKALQEGVVGSRRHVNLPGANIDMPSITDEDWDSIAHAVEAQVDFIGLSFIRKAEEIQEVRAYVRKKKSDIGLIAKIETRQGVDHLEEIFEASDAVMVARGDLGAEIPFEQIPVVQDQIVAMGKQSGKPVIVATHMLESMIENPIPTRAEVTDIAHAAMTFTDVTMLSGETASGVHPLKALDAMDRVLRQTENHLGRSHGMVHAEIRTERDAQAESAVNLALSAKASAIMVMTKTGQFARELARFRPHVPVIAFTPETGVQHTLQLSYGVVPLVTPFHDDPERTVEKALPQAKKAGLLTKGDKFVLVSDAQAHAKTVSSIQVRTA